MIGSNSLQRSQATFRRKKQAERDNEDSISIDTYYEDAVETANAKRAFEETESLNGEIPFIAILPDSSLEDLKLESEDLEICSSEPLISTAEDVRERRRDIPKKAIKYVMSGRLPRFVKKSLLVVSVIFAIHMVCIAIGMYQLSRINPDDIKIGRLYLSGLDSATAKLAAEATVPMPWMARFFRIEVADPKVLIKAGSEEILSVSVPSVIVGRDGGTTIKLDQIEFQASSSDHSPLSILFSHILPFDTGKGDQVRTVDIGAQFRLKTSSFWYPIDMVLNYDHVLDIVELKETMKAQKSESSTEISMPQLTGIKILPIEEAGELGLKLQATVKLPAEIFSPFLTIDVPSLQAEIMVIPLDGSDEKEYSLGFVKTHIL